MHTLLGGQSQVPYLKDMLILLGRMWYLAQILLLGLFLVFHISIEFTP